MKRDMDLIREILIELSEAQGSLDASVFVNDSRSYKLVAYHFQIMGEAGLIVDMIVPTYDNPYYSAGAERLTWEGNEFLASVSLSTVWAKVKSAIAKVAEDAPLSLYQEAASKVIRETLDTLL